MTDGGVLEQESFYSKIDCKSTILQGVRKRKAEVKRALAYLHFRPSPLGDYLLFGLALFFRRDPVVDARFEHVHGERARAEDFVVELAYVEPVA